MARIETMDTTGRGLSEIVFSGPPVIGPRPMDSSTVLAGLMALSRKAAEDSPEDILLDGVISTAILRSLLQALQYRDASIVAHSRRVAKLTLGIAETIGWEGRHLKVLEVAALLHDTGKIGVPDHILFKPGPLCPDERELMSLHYNIGLDVLQACRVDNQVLEIIGDFRSHFDGTTDNFQKIGSDVPMGARILAVADAYDSLNTEQAYRERKPHQEIIRILYENSGTQFDGNIVRALEKLIERIGVPNPAAELREVQQNSSESNRSSAETNLLCHVFSFLYLLESLYDGFYLVDSDLRFVTWSRGAQKLLGYRAGDMLGRVWTSRLLPLSDQHGSAFPDNDYPMHRVVSGERPLNTVGRIRHLEGKWLEVEVQTVPLTDCHKQMHGVAEILRDVSKGGKQGGYRELKIAAALDPLTQVANRGELDGHLTELGKHFAKHPDSSTFSVIFVDLDHFKSINDTFGHQIGDAVLIAVSSKLKMDSFSGEMIGRYGGEEFVLICPETDLKQAIQRAERLRAAISQLAFPEMPDRQVTASFGVAQMEKNDSVESVVRRADAALYSAKQNGRNRVESLTNEQLFQRTEDPTDLAPGEPFLFRARFHAFVPPSMAVFKLGALLRELRAKVIKVGDGSTIFRLGSAGLLPFWGKNEDSQPIEITMSFGEPEISIDPRKAQTSRIAIQIEVRPRGWVSKTEVFDRRAKNVLKTLMSYFLADSPIYGK